MDAPVRVLGVEKKKKLWQKKKLKASLKRQAQREQLSQQPQRVVTVAPAGGGRGDQPAEKKKRKRKRGNGHVSALSATPGPPPTPRSPRLAAAALAAAAQAELAAAGMPQLSLVPSPSAGPSPGPSWMPAFAPPAWDLLYHPAELERRLQPLLSEPAIGVDIEWRPNFVAGSKPNPVALLQLSSMSRCVLVPVRHLRQLPPALAQLLASPRVWKLGVGIVEDARKLLTDLQLVCEPTLEIGDVAARLQQFEGLTFPALAEGEAVRPGLRGVALACGYDLQKPKRLSRSNWEAKPLSRDQQRYAALDAYTGVWIGRCVHALHTHAAGGVDAGAGGLAGWLSEQSALLRSHDAAKPSKNARKRHREAEKKRAKVALSIA